MAYASRSGRAKTNAGNPQAHAICDRCGFRYNHVDLQWQFDWRGASLTNIRLLVCDECNDNPQQQLRAIVVPADPLPIENSRIQDFLAAETDYQAVSAPTVYDKTTGLPIPSTTVYATQDGQNLTFLANGSRDGLEPGAIMPLLGSVHYGVTVPVVSITSAPASPGASTIQVTCTSIGSITVNSQISVEGATDVRANGFYSVLSVAGNSFTYMTNQQIPAGSLLGNNTLVLTANVGVPLNYNQIPKTGV